MSTARERYAALNLRVLEKVGITGPDWQCIEAGAKNYLDKNFRDNLPVIVARWKEAAAEEVMKWAATSPDKKRNYPVQLERLSSQYRDDLCDIHKAFFYPGRTDANAGTTLSFEEDAQVSFEFDARKYTKQITPYLHGDYPFSGHPNEALYICRLGSLPSWSIKWAEVLALPEELIVVVNALVAASEMVQPPNYEAHQKLIDMGLLKPFNLGDVALLSVNTEVRSIPGSVPGTYHCGERIMPGDEKVSAFMALSALMPV